MSLSLTDLQNRFKKLGKLIFAMQQVGPIILTLKKSHIAFVDQIASTTGGTEDDNEEFDLTIDAVMPLGSVVNKTTASIAALTSKYVGAATTILQSYLAPDLGLASGSALTTIGPALVAAMTTAGASVKTDNPTGIYRWFKDNFNFDLPQSDTPSIPDTYVTDVVL